MQKIIGYFFTLLFVIVPVIFYPYSSEVFEFNKMVTVYAFTVAIVASWIIRVIIEKKFIFKKTLLDIPLILFFVSQLISTVTSIDPYTSIFGYYSRFHGGLLSTICYLLLYWSFVSNIDKKSLERIIKYFLYTLIFVSIYAILEHYGHSVSCLVIRGEFNVDCWVQDVQNRVFATMGQPNWLAALLLAAIPLTWYELFLAKEKGKKLFWVFVSVIYFFALLATKSRSGLLAFGLESFIFWVITFFKVVVNKTTTVKKYISFALVLNLIFVLLISLIGTPWTPTITEYLNKKPQQEQINQQKVEGPALEVGGTDSGEIRKIVWAGAIKLATKYPLFGTGVETFAYSYYETRPASHNLVSEWDFLYNKAHNEYLNFAATTGFIGLGMYLLVILISLFQMALRLFRKESKDLLVLALVSGYISILFTNFFGFSVVAVGLCFFLFPALSVAYFEKEETDKNLNLEGSQKVYVGVVLLLALIFGYFILNYWLADYHYSFSKIYQQVGQYKKSLDSIELATKIEPNQAIYHDQLARTYDAFAVALSEQKEDTYASQFANLAQMESDKSFKLSPRNVNIQRSRASIFSDLAGINSNYLYKAVDTHDFILRYAPTDAKALYKAAITFNRANMKDKALETFQKSIELRPSYIDARMAYGQLLFEDKQKAKAKEQFEYILKYLDPDNKLAKESLKKLQ